MPTIYVKLQHGATQMGYNSTGGNLIVGNFNAGCKTDRVNILRFSNVPVPKNSTITSAKLYMVYSGKNNTGTAYTLTQSVYVDTQLPSKPLDTTRNEWTTPARSWLEPSGSTTSTWNFVQGTATSRQIHSHNVKPHLDNMLANAGWTTAGGSVSFLIAYHSVSNPDYVYLHLPADSFSPFLEITYTEPASDGKQTVVNLQENCNMMNKTTSTGSLSLFPYSFNSYFSTFAQPTYSYSDTPAAPYGGSALRVQATTGRSMVLLGLPNLEDGQWYNQSCYIYIPVSAPAGMTVNFSFLGDKGSSPEQSVRGQWVRHNLPFIQAGNNTVWSTVSTSGTTWNSTAEFYVANTQLTKGRLVRPYIDGNQTMSNATYGWAGLNTAGFVRASPPVVTANTQKSKARRKFYAFDWNYTNPAGHAQVLANVQIRRAVD